MINRSTHEKDKGFLNAFVPKNRTEKQIIVGDFNTILTKHGRIPPKILKNVTVSRFYWHLIESSSIRIHIP